MENDGVLEKGGFTGHGSILLGFCIVVFVQPIAIKILGQYDYAIIGYLDDLFYLFALLVVTGYSSRLIEFKYFNNATVSYLIFVVFGVISAYKTGYGRALGQMLLQIIVDFKFLIFMLLFFIYKPDWRTITRIENLFKITLVLGIPLCLLQWFSPSLNDALFYSLGTKYDFQVGGLHLPRLAGIFWHPYLTSFFLCITTFYFIYLSKNRFYAYLSLLQLIFTFQRQEIVTFLFLLVLVVYLYRNSIKSKINIALCILGVFIAAVYFMDGIADYVEATMDAMDIASLNDTQEPRVVVAWYGLLLAVQQFPLGVGFGNFGGTAAMQYDATLYYKFNFDQFWWFGKEDFLTDTYYPHIYAEAGFLGFACYVLCLWCVFKLFFSSIGNRELRGATVFLIFFLYIVALTSPVLNSPFALALVGLLLTYVKKLDQELGKNELREEQKTISVL